MTHSAHYDKTSYSIYSNTETIIKDSWACAVAYVMTVDMYGSNSRYYDKKRYTGLIIDLIDDKTTFAETYDSGDYVKGYTFPQLWNVVKSSKTVNAFKTIDAQYSDAYFVYKNLIVSDYYFFHILLEGGCGDEVPNMYTLSKDYYYSKFVR